jgi:hypothetical protein
MLGSTKSLRCMSYVGCTLDDLKQHLESKFQDNMSLENWLNMDPKNQI